MNGDIVMILLERLPPSYKYLIMDFEKRLMNDFTIEFIMATLMYKGFNRKENEPYRGRATLFLQHYKGGTSQQCKET